MQTCPKLASIVLLSVVFLACVPVWRETKMTLNAPPVGDDSSPKLLEEEHLTRTQLTEILMRAKIDIWEHPEFYRVLNFEQAQLTLIDAVRRRREVLAALPTLTPAEGWISSNYGKRPSPFSRNEILHKGIDIAGNIGTPIYAPADGVIRFANKYGGFGNYLALVHGYGIVTKYAHCQTLHVKAGQQVKRGDLLATIGNTGRSTGAHLHYEVWLNDRSIDPEMVMTTKPAIHLSRQNSDAVMLVTVNAD